MRYEKKDSEESFLSKELIEFNPLLEDYSHVERLSLENNIPEEDILISGLNASGISFENVTNDRGRFTVTLPSGRKYFLALTITSNPRSPFFYHEGSIYLGDKKVAEASEIEKDTCTDSYWRGGKNHLTLNSNSRSNCRGCTFCGTYSLEDDDKALTDKGSLRRKAQELVKDKGSDFTDLKSIGVVTGCFPDETKLVDHLVMIREVFSEFGFNGELQYIGSQIRTEESLKKLSEMGKFAIYLTVEAFQNREKLMKRTKASLTLESGRELLKLAKTYGIETSFLYIVGLDSLEKMTEEFPKYKDVITRLPQAQTFQAYVPAQMKEVNSGAYSMDYFLKARKIIEASYPDLAPKGYLNYRSLWYTKYGDHDLPNEAV